MVNRRELGISARFAYLSVARQALIAGLAIGALIWLTGGSWGQKHVSTT
ncbi:hypothetical protein [Pediococcus acidilactici]|nr:hypothetical protein [Pediococcus acidilactici]MDB8875762.1 hypothetical protein [Pediococcus acidilactici]